MTIDYLTFSNFAIDDIVFPDGRTAMNVMGGGGFHAVVGMRLWSDRVGYAAAVGYDFSPEHRQALIRFGVDLSGLRRREGFQTSRTWLVMEWDERRAEISRTPEEDFRRMRILPEELPASYRQARGVHIAWGRVAEVGELIVDLRRTNPEMIIVYELSTSNLGESAETIKRVLPHLNLFSPNLEEASIVTHQTEPTAICATFLDWGAPLVALRMGAAGSLIRTQDGRGWRLPAVPPTALIDVTGAGNGYLGGFLTGLGDGLNVLEAALRGVVSASFALEQRGLPNWVVRPAAEAERRLQWARERVEEIF